MDTTSHNFTWQIDTLGVTSSVLYDVAIINDTLAYAVGEIFLRDSTGQLDPVYYNVAKWNGRRWEIFRILSNCRLYYPNCGPVILTVATGRAVFAFAWNDIWIAAGGIHHFDGSQWTEQRAIVEVGSTNKIWGSSSSNLWLVGNNGLITNYNGSTWQRVESGTDVRLTDIWGVRDRETNESFVVTVGSYTFSPGERSILRITGNTVESIPWVNNRRAHSIWFASSSRWYLCGDGVWTRKPDKVWYEVLGIPVIPYFTEHVRGVASNNVFAVGDFGVVTHFNGITWRIYQEGSLADIFYSVAYNGHLMVSVGFVGQRALALRGIKS